MNQTTVAAASAMMSQTMSDANVTGALIFCAIGGVAFVILGYILYKIKEE